MLDSSYGITIDFTPMIYPWLSFKIMILITKVTKDTGSRGMTSWGSRDSSAQIPQGIIWILQAGQVLSTCSWSPTGKYPGATAMTSACSAPRTGSSWRTPHILRIEDVSAGESPDKWNQYTLRFLSQYYQKLARPYLRIEDVSAGESPDKWRFLG